LKLLVCTSEYYPRGSGIANVAYNVVEQLKKKGITCEVCSPVGPDIKIGTEIKYGRLSLLKFWNAVVNYFRYKNDYDVVWLHNPLFINKIPFDKCLVTIHTTPHGQVAKKIYPWHYHIYKKITSYIDEYCLKNFNKETKFTAVDMSVLNQMVNLGISRENIKYIPNGVDVDLFNSSKENKSLRQKMGIPANDIILLSYGRITEVKRPLKLIELFSEICKDVNNVTLIFAGDGELLDKAKNLAKRKNLMNIKFLGYIDHKKVAPTLLASSDYYILISKYEGQPLTLLEAMASGLKCIVSDLPNLKMIIDMANCGIAVDVNKGHASDKILKYLKSDNSDHKINARRYAVKNFNWEIIANIYLDEFRKILSDV